MWRYECGMWLQVNLCLLVNNKTIFRKSSTHYIIQLWPNSLQHPILVTLYLPWKSMPLISLLLDVADCLAKTVLAYKTLDNYHLISSFKQAFILKTYYFTPANFMGHWGIIWWELLWLFFGPETEWPSTNTMCHTRCNLTNHLGFSPVNC